MFNIKQTIFINRPVEEVFAFMSDLENDPKWWKGVKYSRKLTAGALRPGTEYYEDSYVLGIKITNHLKLITYQPPNLVEYTNDSPQLAYKFFFKCKPEGNGTNATIDATISAGGILNWILPLIMGAIKSQTKRFFNELKIYLESQPA